MFILLNGAFGIGKTTTAAALIGMADGAAIHDPEPLGVAMQRLSGHLRWQGRIDDFQDLASWRRMVAWGARLRHRRAGTVIVPMAFTNLAYFEGLARALERSAPVRKLCLTAPLPLIRQRLKKRAIMAGKPIDKWAFDRAEECCLAHRSQAFGHAIDASGTTEEIVRAIVALGAFRPRFRDGTED